MSPGHQTDIGDRYPLLVPPKPYNLHACTLALPTYMHHQKFIQKLKIRHFFRKCRFCCFCCVLGVANVVFQNLQDQEIFLAIFIFLIRRLVQKLFNFEVMFR